MKVGIMSMQRIINYGSFMQALSLKRILEELGHTVVFVDYVPKPNVHNRKNIRLQVRSSLRYIKKKFYPWSLMKKLRPNNRDGLYEKFLDCYSWLDMTEKRCFHTKVDVLVIGSDEVFNCLQSGVTVGFSMELFGQNNRAKRLISYAASFGSTTLDKLKEYGVTNIIKSHLNRFSAISVRDNNSNSIVRELTGKEPYVHLDPVLVGGVENIAWKPVNTTGKYVAVYGYKGRFSEQEAAEIQKFAHNNGMKTISIMDEQSFCDEVVTCRPDEILSYVRNAEYVITDTFHGTIFSIIFHKPFAVFCRKKSDTGSTNKEKLLDLLQRLNLMDRVIENINDIPEIIAKEINYSYIDDIRTNERIKTQEYLAEQCKVTGWRKHE